LRDTGYVRKNKVCRKCGLFGDMCICDELKRIDKLNKKEGKK
jgi:hypothetical protein